MGSRTRTRTGTMQKVLGSYLFFGEAEDADDGAGEHDFFVRANDVDGYFAVGSGNDGGGKFVSLWIEVEAKKLQTVADAGANDGRVFADAAGEDECVQSVKRGGKCADPFAGLIAKHRYGFGGADVLFFARKEVAHVWTGF